MYCWIQRPQPNAAPASTSGRVEEAEEADERRHQSTASKRTTPVSNVITISALPLSVHRTSDGGPTTNSAVAIHATEREHRRSTRRKFRHRKTTKQASVTAFSATTVDPAKRKTMLDRYTSGTPL